MGSPRRLRGPPLLPPCPLWSVCFAWPRLVRGSSTLSGPYPSLVWVSAYHRLVRALSLLSRALSFCHRLVLVCFLVTMNATVMQRFNFLFTCRSQKAEGYRLISDVSTNN